MENLLSIGEFASASQLSQKALRLYGENALLPPAWVDPDSGYRYYHPDQLREATLIALLRRTRNDLGRHSLVHTRADRRAARGIRTASGR